MFSLFRSKTTAKLVLVKKNMEKKNRSLLKANCGGSFRLLSEPAASLVEYPVAGNAEKTVFATSPAECPFVFDDETSPQDGEHCKLEIKIFSKIAEHIPH